MPQSIMGYSNFTRGPGKVNLPWQPLLHRHRSRAYIYDCAVQLLKLVLRWHQEECHSFNFSILSFCVFFLLYLI